MKIYPDTKVCIVCPGNFYTGGTELCHQLASKLLSAGIPTYIYYVPIIDYDKFDENDPVSDQLKKYHVPYAFELDDKPQNILISPEGSTSSLYFTKEMQRVIWWMSVDNYISNVINILKENLKNPLAEALTRTFRFGEEDSDIEHWIQSEYARQFVKLNGIPDERIYTVEDYLHPAFLSRAAQVDLNQKKNIVAYNPKKGLEITKSLIEVAPDIDWQPIYNMTPAQVQELLAKAKVYIDFGNHPGRDRIPREAAISGCVVIVGKRGAAANDIDINIPDEFKIEETTAALDIISKIRAVFENFEADYEKQADYRVRILDDKNRFNREVEEVFAIKENPLQSVAFVQGLNEDSFLLVQEIYQHEGFLPSFIVDDTMATENAAELLPELITREQHRNFISDGKKLIKIITRDDAKFLYHERRIKKFAALDPSEAELDDLQNFYESKDDDLLIFNR